MLRAKYDYLLSFIMAAAKRAVAATATAIPAVIIFFIGSSPFNRFIFRESAASRSEETAPAARAAFKEVFKKAILLFRLGYFALSLSSRIDPATFLRCFAAIFLYAG